MRYSLVNDRTVTLSPSRGTASMKPTLGRAPGSIELDAAVAAASAQAAAAGVSADEAEAAAAAAATFNPAAYIAKPAGGSNGDLLTKSGTTAVWAPPPDTLPPGGLAGQILTKQSGTDGDADWEDPSTGNTAPDVQLFDTSGTWTKPAGATRVRVIAVGGGGGGSANGAVTSGGGAAGAIDLTLLASDFGATSTITVGAGGTAGGLGTTGGAGGNTTITSLLGTITCNGGGPGTPGGSVSIAGRVTVAGTASGNSDFAVSTYTFMSGNIAGRLIGGAANGAVNIDRPTHGPSGGGNNTVTAASAASSGRTLGGAIGAPGVAGDLTVGRFGSGAGSVSSGVGQPGGKYGGGGGRGITPTGGAGGQGGACLITYFD